MYWGSAHLRVLTLSSRTAKVSPRTHRGKTSQEKRIPVPKNYGVGEEVVVVVVSDELLPVAGAGVEITFVVFVVLVSVDFEVAGDGFTIVVLFSVLSAGEAAGATVSVFCSHAARSAALARMQMYFFISCGLNGHNGANPDSEQGMFSVLLKDKSQKLKGRFVV
ncbi:MAG: hypothetical protein ABJB22_01330 [Verrucomicrobiota bacterium]